MPSTSRAEFRQTLKHCSKAFEISLEAGDFSAYEVHFTLLQKWSAQINLTAVSRPDCVARDLFLFSLWPEKHQSTFPGRWLDVGSGGGFPALPLAVRHPKTHFTLIEAREKKCFFLDTCIRAMHLENVTVRHTRLENALDNLAPAFDWISVRGVGTPNSLHPSLSHLASPKTLLFFYAGKEQQQQLKQHLGFQLIHTVPFRSHSPLALIVASLQVPD